MRQELFPALGAFNAHPCTAAVFREVSAQALAEPGGSWAPGAQARTDRCAPPNNDPAAEAASLAFRQNEAVHRLAARHGVPVLPFYELSRARWDAHEEKICQIAQTKPDGSFVQCTDCTHFCASPTLTARMVSDWSALLDARRPAGAAYPHSHCLLHYHSRREVSGGGHHGHHQRLHANGTYGGEA